MTKTIQIFITKSTLRNNPNWTCETRFTKFV